MSTFRNSYDPNCNPAISLRAPPLPLSINLSLRCSIEKITGCRKAPHSRKRHGAGWRNRGTGVVIVANTALGIALFEAHDKQRIKPVEPVVVGGLAKAISVLMRRRRKFLGVVRYEPIIHAENSPDGLMLSDLQKAQYASRKSASEASRSSMVLAYLLESSFPEPPLSLLASLGLPETYQRPRKNQGKDCIFLLLFTALEGGKPS